MPLTVSHLEVSETTGLRMEIRDVNDVWRGWP